MDEIECLKYMYVNLSTQRKTLKGILKRYNYTDDLSVLIAFNIRECSRFMVSLKYMIKNRANKGKNGNTNNGMVNAIASIEDIAFQSSQKNEIIEYIKEASKINILEIKRVEKEYNIKSKTIRNLMTRMLEFERFNLENIKKVNKTPKNVN